MGKLVVRGLDPQPCPPDIAARVPTAWKSDAPLAERGIKVLGTPFGTDEFVMAFGARVAAEREQLLQYILKLPYLQASWLLLYFCAVPRSTTSCARCHRIEPNHSLNNTTTPY